MKEKDQKPMIEDRRPKTEDRRPKTEEQRLQDKIMNVRDITNNPPVKWTVSRTRKYLDWSEKVVAGLRGTHDNLEAIFDETLQTGKEKYFNRR
jgi:guanosine-3',5'-bis(diphosphate) 3'-pyrophosphohydrolase